MADTNITYPTIKLYDKSGVQQTYANVNTLKVSGESEGSIVNFSYIDSSTTIELTNTTVYDVKNYEKAQIDVDNINNLKEEYIKNGIKILGITGKYEGESNNSPLNIKLGSSAPSVSDIPTGYTGYAVPTFTIESSEISADKILKGTTILGVDGAILSSSGCSATADTIIKGKTAIVNNTEITGTLAPQTETWISLDSSSAYYVKPTTTNPSPHMTYPITYTSNIVFTGKNYWYANIKPMLAGIANKTTKYKLKSNYNMYWLNSTGGVGNKRDVTNDKSFGNYHFYDTGISEGGNHLMACLFYVNGNALITV